MSRAMATKAKPKARNRNPSAKYRKAWLEKAKTLSEALPYMRSYAGETIVIKFGCHAMGAKGLAKLFAIHLPRNFLEPYLAANPKGFWRRWHVTLSYGLRDYVYLRRGGNGTYVRNIQIVFLAVGPWDRTGWKFLVWGGWARGAVWGGRALSACALS